MLSYNFGGSVYIILDAGRQHITEICAKTSEREFARKTAPELILRNRRPFACHVVQESPGHSRSRYRMRMPWRRAVCPRMSKIEEIAPVITLQERA